MGTNYKKLITDVCEERLSEEDIFNLNWRWKNVVETINSSNYLKINSNDGLAEFLTFIYKKGDLLENTIQIDNKEYLYIQGLVRIFERNRQWLRSFSNWKPNSHNKRKQFSHFLRHLFGKYEIPAFMDNVWFRNDPGSYRYRDWYVNLTRGESLRKQKSKILVTKKIAHYFGTAPPEYSVEEALWWGIVMSLGGNERIAIEFNAANPSQSYENQEFWKGFIRYIIANPMIDKSQIGPIIDFINFQKFDDHETYENDSIVTHPPPQPNFSLNNRNPNTLLRLVREWHRHTSQIKFDDFIRFDSSAIKPYFSPKLKDAKTTFSIRQITNNFELYKEGEVLGHCVGSYVSSCRNNHCTIWSLTQHDAGKKKKLVTIEVDSKKEIVEARGKFNRYPKDKEFAIIKKWAAQEDLQISRWLYMD